jgi:hypothetical protein
METGIYSDPQTAAVLVIVTVLVTVRPGQCGGEQPNRYYSAILHHTLMILMYDVKTQTEVKSPHWLVRQPPKWYTALLRGDIDIAASTQMFGNLLGLANIQMG